MKLIELDQFYLKKTFALAKKGKGYVSPNPLVGSILVKNGNIIGEGWHQKFGEAHAEINAINSAKDSVSGATLYCNLEPCCHLNKKTPPCVDRIIKEGIQRVVVSNLDPNPEVNGKGLEKLKNAGIEVKSGILEEEGKQLNRFFNKYISKKNPYVTIKIAQTLDGKIAPAVGKQEWLTCSASNKVVHKWRSEYDAVLVGAGTVLTDNSQLTVRHVSGRDPYRVILDGRLCVDRHNSIFDNENPEKTIIITSTKSDQSKIDQLLLMGIRIIKLDTSFNNKIRIAHVLAELGKMGISSILVEGGSQIFSQFISQNYFDDIKVFITPKYFGKGVPALSGNIAKSTRLKLINHQQIDKDILLTYTSVG